MTPDEVGGADRGRVGNGGALHLAAHRTGQPEFAHQPLNSYVNGLPWPLTGRLAEMRLIEAAIFDRGSSGIVICGVAGVGKSHVAREALDFVASKGFMKSLGIAVTWTFVILGNFGLMMADKRIALECNKFRVWESWPLMAAVGCAVNWRRAERPNHAGSLTVLAAENIEFYRCRRERSCRLTPTLG